MNARREEQAEPKRARVDTGTENARQIAERVYNDAFLSELRQQFDFNASSETTARLRDIAKRYILGRRSENQPNLLKSIRREYIELKEATESYLALLKQYEERDIGSDMKLAAQLLSWPKPETNDPDGYYHQLVLLLELLHTATIRQADHLNSRGGRPKNYGLEDLTRHAADFWITELGRSFTIDHHQGAGLTAAFDFIKALVVPLDDITDRQIITAIRTEISNRRPHGPPR